MRPSSLHFLQGRELSVGSLAASVILDASSLCRYSAACQAAATCSRCRRRRRRFLLRLCPLRRCLRRSRCRAALGPSLARPTPARTLPTRRQLRLVLVSHAGLAATSSTPSCGEWEARTTSRGDAGEGRTMSIGDLHFMCRRKHAPLMVPLHLHPSQVSYICFALCLFAPCPAF